MQHSLMAGDSAGALTNDIIRTAIATGLVAISAVAAIILLYTVGQPFGTVNDVLNALIGVGGAILAILVFRAFGGSPLVTGLAVIGAVIAALGSWLVISGTTGFVLAGFVSTIGFALIGAWLVVSASGDLGAALPSGLRSLGLVGGVAMGVGVIGVAGVVMRINSFGSMPWWLWLFSISWMGTYLLFPAWCLLMSRAR